jgi:hypothetical protein
MPVLPILPFDGIGSGRIVAYPDITHFRVMSV